MNVPSSISGLSPSLGLFLDGKVVVSEHSSFRYWGNGNVAGYTILAPHSRNSFWTLCYLAHWAHSHESMQKIARALGVRNFPARKVSNGSGYGNHVFDTLRRIFFW